MENDNLVDEPLTVDSILTLEQIREGIEILNNAGNHLKASGWNFDVRFDTQHLILKCIIQLGISKPNATDRDFELAKKMGTFAANIKKMFP